MDFVDALVEVLPVIIFALHAHFVWTPLGKSVVRLEERRRLNHKGSHHFIILVVREMTVIDVAGELYEVIFWNMEERVWLHIRVVGGISPTDSNPNEGCIGNFDGLFPLPILWCDGKGCIAVVSVGTIWTLLAEVFLGLNILICHLGQHVESIDAWRCLFVFEEGLIHVLNVGGVIEVESSNGHAHLEIVFLPRDDPSGNEEVNLIVAAHFFLGKWGLGGNSSCHEFKFAHIDLLEDDEVDVHRVRNIVEHVCVDEIPILCCAYFDIVALTVQVESKMAVN